MQNIVKQFRTGLLQTSKLQSVIKQQPRFNHSEQSDKPNSKTEQQERDYLFREEQVQIREQLHNRKGQFSQHFSETRPLKAIFEKYKLGEISEQLEEDLLVWKHTQY
ncbi:hypothetical protein PPERSA_10731 [Pseudocohnilembus persalinus]|uniref:Uncharacterized protein n=1 Tax=Pseudocohnilembus persalinus TaxID=266149 RepID=A0A0V0QDJ6_PSEPJ|nr:hypothetical protein PPERSA_10731 [Pseudocohnilembus persalinus]|eukprot:KRX00232.1 hypothetical protein PPERSA_10731 [Pseudocohnilembus persalinus]